MSEVRLSIFVSLNLKNMIFLPNLNSKKLKNSNLDLLE